MATELVRWDCARTLLELMRNHPGLTGVQISAGWPGDEVAAEAVWLDDIDGDISIPVMSAGRKYRDDIFTIPIEARVAGVVTLDAGLERVIEIVGAVESLLADDPGLEAFDGVVAATVTGVRHSAGMVKGAGCLAFGEVTVAVHARYE